MPKDTKPPTVTLNLAITYPAKPDMTFKDFAAEGEKASAIKTELEKYGKVEGAVVIGKQRLAL